MNAERLRQIAILVDSLDTAQADRLLDQLPEATRQAVRQAVMDLPQIDEGERQAIIQDFVSRKKSERAAAPSPSMNTPAMAGTYGDPRSMYRDSAATQAGSDGEASSVSDSQIPEYQKYLNRKSQSSERAGLESQTDCQPTAVVDRPMTRTHNNHSTGSEHSPGHEGDLVDVLSQADIETLAAVVMKETPQVLAVVLSMLPADKSAQLLELFPDSQRQDALQRLANLDDIDEQVLDHLQQQLDRIVRRRLKLKRNQRSGPQALAAILSAARRLNSNEVVNSIHQQFQAGNQNEPANQPASSASTAPRPLPTAGRKPMANQRPNPQPSLDPQINRQQAQPQESVASQLLNQSMAAAAERNVDRQPTNRVSMATRTRDSRSPSDILVSQESTAGQHQDRRDDQPSSDPESRLASMEVNQVDAFADAEVRFEFARLAQCDRSSLEALLATARPKLTLLALRGATPKLLTRVLRLLPANEAKEVEYRIQNLGATRLQDIQQAQQYLLRLASVLEDMGRFRSPRKSLLSF